MLTFRVQGTDRTFTMRPRRLVIAVYTGRDQEAVRRHVEELRAHGIPAPPRVPTLFACTVDRLTIRDGASDEADDLEVLGDRTSGEAEFVLIGHDGELYVAVGSDHTDRELEKTSITFSKQVCPKPLSRDVWPYADLRDRWDELRLRGRAGDRDGYQAGTLGEMLRPEALIALVAERLGDAVDGMVLYGGTLPILDGGGFALGRGFVAELEDPCAGRLLRCAYAVRETPLAGDG